MAPVMNEMLSKAAWLKSQNPFETRKRTNGEVFVCMKDEHHYPAESWQREAVYECHDDMGPDDWIFAECEAAWLGYVEALEYGNEEDWIHAHADSQVDVYTKALYRWAADFCHSSLYAEAEERANELGGDGQTMTERLQTVQYCAIARIAETMQAAMDQAWEEHEDEPS